MTIDRQQVLHDLNLKDTLDSSRLPTPLMFSRDSSMDTLSSFNVNFHSHNSTYASEHSTNPSGILSPSDIPDSPPRGCDEDIDFVQHQSFSQPLNNTHSTGRTVVAPPPEPFHTDDDDDQNVGDNHIDDEDVDSIRNFASSPLMLSYNNGGDTNDDDNVSIHSSLSSLTLPPMPPSTSGTTLMSNIQDIRNLKHNLSVINEESLNEPHDRRSSSFNTSRTTTDDDDDDDQKGKQLLFALIRQRLPHHNLSITVNPATNAILNRSKEKTSKDSSSSSLCINDQTMREDTSVNDISSHDITIPSSSMQESGYDSLLPMGSAPKRSLSNASLSTTRSVTIKKKHRRNEENDDPMTSSRSSHEMTDDDDEHYDKKAGEALLRNLISQVLPSFNPRYLNGDNEEDEEIVSNPRRPSPISRTNSSSNASSIRSIDIESDINKKFDKNFSMRPAKGQITEIIQQEKIQAKRSYVHKTVQQTKASELRRLQTHSRR